METQSEILCPLCNKPILLQIDMSADENGKAVHTECYAKRISQANNRPEDAA